MNTQDNEKIKRPIPIAIPTLTQYAKLVRLCRRIQDDYSNNKSSMPIIYIIDNGGKLAETSAGRMLSKLEKIIITTPQYNLGVASSWNIFAKQIGRCIIANDDVLFGKRAVDEFTNASECNPQSIIIENDHPVGGFSTFLLNKPKEWMRLGGFDELFNPAYFEDNDTRYRLKLAGQPVAKIKLSDWEHDNSSTLTNSTCEYQRMHWCFFKRNSEYYVKKWGGTPGCEKYKQPFGNLASKDAEEPKNSFTTDGTSTFRRKILDLLKRLH